MALLANVSLTNTFDTWRTRTNQLVTRINQFAINESSLYANTLTSNTAFTAKGTATVTGLFTASGRATVGTNLTVSGNTTIGAAGKTANVTGWFGVLGRASVSTNLRVSGNTNFGAVGKVSNTTGWFGVAGRATVSTNLFVGANTYVMGNMGIGTSLPVAKLDVSGSINFGSSDGSCVAVGTTNTFTPSGGSPTAYYGMTFGGFVTNSISLSGYNGIAMYTGAGSERMRIASSGLVTACNSMTVTQNLTVSGNTTLNGTTIDKSNSLSQTLTDGATINWDVSLGRVATVTLGAAGRTMAAPTNLKVGTYILRVYQDGTGSRTITTWNSVFKWTAAVAPVLSTGAGKLDIITFFSDGTNLYGSYLPDMR
jgi:hypothetical protein